jgi:hypothetical protein
MNRAITALARADSEVYDTKTLFLECYGFCEGPFMNGMVVW